MVKQIALVLLAMAALCLAGCQTIGGLGGDLKWTGQQIEAGADNCSIPPSDDQPKSK